MQLGVSMQALVLNRLNIDDLATVAGMHAHVTIDGDGNTVEPRYSEPLKCGHLVLMDVLLRYGLNSH